MRKMPTVTRYLLIGNFAIYLLDRFLHLGLFETFGLWSANTPFFHWWQPFTYMFLHDTQSFGHIFFNMFAVWMFAPVIENEWGSRRFAIYYLICGLGAALVQELVWMATGIQGVAVGASGAVFGILFAFGWLYPDVPMYILFLPIPIRARTFVIIYAAIELVAGLGSILSITPDSVAHFAHLGGFVFGWLLILYWKKIGWGDPKIFKLWDKIKSLFHNRHPRLDSTKDDQYKDFHYQKRV